LLLVGGAAQEFLRLLESPGALQQAGQVLAVQGIKAGITGLVGELGCQLFQDPHPLPKERFGLAEPSGV